jgi:sorting nexin-8
VVRSKLALLIEQWQKICILAERIIRRREAVAVRSLPLLRPTYLPTHFALSPFSSSSGSVSPTSSIFSGFSFSTPHPDPDEQADLSRLTNAFRVLNEGNQPLCWRGEDCELSGGVKQGLERVSEHLQIQADLVDQRASIFYLAPFSSSSIR